MLDLTPTFGSSGDLNALNRLSRVVSLQELCEKLERRRLEGDKQFHDDSVLNSEMQLERNTNLR